MRCETCSYPIFQYSKCCPGCSNGVNLNGEAKALQVPQTRIGFLLVSLRRNLVPNWLRATSA